MSFSGPHSASVSKKMCEESTSPLDANERDGHATATDEEPILAIAKAIPQRGTAEVQCMEVEDCLINRGNDEDSDPIYRRQSSSITPVGYFRRSSPRVYGRHTIRMKCQYCDEEMWTRATPIIDAFSVVGAIVLAFLWWPLFWIPLLLPCFKTTVHSCTKCQKEVGWHTPYQCSS